jgi:hypothetical protein
MRYDIEAKRFVDKEILGTEVAGCEAACAGGTAQIEHA